MTGDAALRGGIARLAAAGVPDAATDARRLLAFALDLPPGRLTLVLGDVLPDTALARFQAALARRADRVPVAQITGRRSFWGRDFRVTADTLDPRPETEILVAAALEEPFGDVLDLGTGTGCILLTLLAERPDARGTGVDASAAALAVAAGNARALGLADRAQFLQSDWFAAVPGRHDLIVANPPYIAADEMPALDPDVRDHEPALALTDGGDGLGAYRAILAAAPRHLAPGGRILMEIGPRQARAVTDLGRAAGLVADSVRPDFDGRDRVVIFRVPAPH